jgi:hypothetical protein
MNCYAGLAKRLVKSCFPEVIPVPQLEPLDARNIIKQEVKNISTTKECFALNEEVLKPISDEEAWEAALVWAEAKAQERESLATKEESHTDTDESYDSDDSDDIFGPAMAGLMKTDAPCVVVAPIGDAAAAAAMWRDDAQADAYESVAVKKALEALDKLFPSSQKYTAATIIQAAARGRAVRAWNAIFTDGLAHELVHIYRSRYLMRYVNEMTALEQHLAEQWTASPKYAKAWLKLAERRRYGNHFRQIHRM